MEADTSAPRPCVDLIIETPRGGQDTLDDGHNNMSIMRKNDSWAEWTKSTTNIIWSDWKQKPGAEVVGRGQYGKCVRYIHKATGDECVVKKQDNTLRARLETQCLAACSHANIATFLGWKLCNRSLHLAMEDCQGKELFHYINNKLSANTFMELSTIRQVTRQLLEAVRYLHDEMHMMHRDIKPENIIFDPLTNRIKLVDFGYACRDEFRDSSVGTP